VTAAPVSALAKAVRDVTTNGSFATSTDASQGDTIEYRLIYTNTGNAAAANVVLSDPVPSGTTYLSCSQTPACTTGGSPVSSVSWTFASVAPGTTITVTFRVQLGSSYAPGTTTAVTNVATLCTTEEGCKNSPPATVNVKTPKSSLAKAVRDVTTDGTFATSTSASPGDVVEYRITYTNSGPGTATNVLISDPVPAHSTYLSCTPVCQTVGQPVTTVSWPASSVAAGASVTLTFQVRLDTTFPAGTTTITNVASATTDQEAGTTSSNQTTVTVTAAPNLQLGKSVDASGVVVVGDQITYTLVYSNTGNAPATGTTVTETVPAGTTFVSCTAGCAVNGSTVTWGVGTVNPGGVGAVTLTVAVATDVGCATCNTAQVASPVQGGGAPVSSNQVCIQAQPAANPAGAHASGSAVGASVVADLALVGPVNQTLASTSSSQTGVGVDAHDDELAGVPVPADGSLLRADLLAVGSSSTVSTTPVQARDLSTAETLGVNVANGLVTADVVLGSAEATATGDAASTSSAGSTFTNPKVQGVALTDVAPNTTLVVGDVLGLGLGVTVGLREETGGTSGPAATTLSGGTYAADLTVRMIHVHVADGNLLKGGKQPIDIVVSQATAHADFPQTRVCDANPTRTVSGHALVASATTNPLLTALSVAYTSIPGRGGQQHVALDQTALPDDGSVVTTGAVDSLSSGTVTLGGTSSSDAAYAAVVCLKLTGAACDIQADAVRAASYSSATATSRGSADAFGSTFTELVGLRVGSMTFSVTPPPNTVIPIPGVATVILNEQVCDNGGTLAQQCADGTQAGHSGLTVRAIHVILFDPVNGPGGEIVVAEAHSDATFR
jgi:uncharacterized repeat protein (TIGR01451 family)